MLSEISLRNFKCFSRHTIPLRAITVIVGRNNAGKSTIVEALRLVSLVASRLEFLPFSKRAAMAGHSKCKRRSLPFTVQPGVGLRKRIPQLQ